MTTSFHFFEYSNYRLLLKDYIAFRKSQNQIFSYRWFAQRAGFTSPNFLKLVIDGKRDMSEDSIERLIKTFSFKKAEADFFRNLVLMNQAKGTEARRVFADKLISSKYLGKLKPLTASKFKYYAHWYHIPIREMILLPDFDEDPQVIAKRLLPPIKPEAAKEALQNLLDLGLVVRDETGRLRVTEASITTGDEFSSTSVVAFHKKMMALAAESIDRTPREEREISSSTITVSKKSVPQLKRLIHDFRMQLLQLAEQESAPGETKDEVYQINFQLFPLTKRVSENGGDL